MEAQEQKEGEARVRALLVDPLMERGLGRPSHLTREGFEAMLVGLCRKLAYMDAEALAALEEVAAASPSGKDRSRFPIANDILAMAARIQPPPDAASPLMRAVFAHAIGRRAIDEGWAPELLDELRRTRRWPGDFVLTKLRQEAAGAARRAEHLAAQPADCLSPAEAGWLAHRRRMVDKCRNLGAGQGVSE